MLLSRCDRGLGAGGRLLTRARAPVVVIRVQRERRASRLAGRSIVVNSFGVSRKLLDGSSRSEALLRILRDRSSSALCIWLMMEIKGPISPSWAHLD